MSLNRTAKGIVLVPALLLGGAFLSAAVWGEATETRPLALGLGLALLLPVCWPSGCRNRNRSRSNGRRIGKRKEPQSRKIETPG